MKVIGNNAILLRQEGVEGGAGVPPQTEQPTFKFDIEEVKSSGLFVPKDEFEKTVTNFKKQIESTKTQSYNKLGEVLDTVASEITSLTGIERIEIEKEGKKEREQLADYVKRVLTAKQSEPLEKEKQIREIYSKKEKEYTENLSKLQQENISLRYNSELQGATSKVLAGISDEKELEKANKVVTAILSADYTKEYSTEYNRFVYKDNNGEVIAKNGEPKTTIELLAEVAENYLSKNNPQLPRGLGNAKLSNNNSQKPYTKQDVHNMVAQKGFVLGTGEYQVEFSKLVKEYNIKT